MVENKICMRTQKYKKYLNYIIVENLKKNEKKSNVSWRKENDYYHIFNSNKMIKKFRSKISFYYAIYHTIIT